MESRWPLFFFSSSIFQINHSQGGSLARQEATSTFQLCIIYLRGPNFYTTCDAYILVLLHERLPHEFTCILYTHKKKEFYLYFQFGSALLEG